MSAAVVVDLGFGDAGKGITVDRLCADFPRTNRILVIRASGGHQVGHTVRLDGYTHSFSNFGSGGLRGVPSYYTAETTVFPPGMAAEARVLGDRVSPLYLHPLAMVCTPWDIAWNRSYESLAGHGSCGVGYGATVERNRAGIRLGAKDLDCAWILKEKLRGIRAYYEERLSSVGIARLPEVWEIQSEGIDDDAFAAACAGARHLWTLETLDDLLPRYDRLIFEGNQGILLDELEGAYPHFTWGATTSRPALECLAGIVDRSVESVEILYVTRCYQTRHGAGPMSSADSVELLNAESESNVENPWQGPFRVAELDPELLRWSLKTDVARQEGLVRRGRFLAGGELCPFSRSLVVTCLDQRPEFNIQNLVSSLGIDFSRVFGSFSPESRYFKLFIAGKWQ